VLGLDARAAKITWTVFLISFLLATAWQVRSAILVFVLALFIAYMLHPSVHAVHRRMRGRLSWTGSVAITFTVLAGLSIVLMVWLGGQIYDQAQSLVQQFPELVRKGSNLDSQPVPPWLEPYRERIIAFLREQANSGSERIIPLLQHALGGVAGFVSGFVYLLILPILAFLFLKDGTEIRDYALGWLPDGNRGFASLLLEDVHKLLAQYIRALAWLSVASGVAYAIFLESIGMPYALLLAMAAAVLEFIPYAGPAMATAIIFVVALFSGFAHLWWIVIFYVVYRLVQDYLILPHLMSRGVELHPLAVLFGAFAGEALGGLWGVFLSVPVLAALRILAVHLVKSRTVQDELAASDQPPAAT